MNSNNDTFKTMPCKYDNRNSRNRCVYSHSCAFAHYDSDGKMREVQFFRNWFGKEPLMCGSCEIFPSLMDDEFPEMVNFLKKKNKKNKTTLEANYCPTVSMTSRPWPVRHYDTPDVNDEVAYIPEALLLSIPAREVPPTKVKETPTEVKDVYHRKANRGIYSPHIYIFIIYVYIYIYV